uniref:AlNc14C25G2526 protein n=1 Tax=Albugo laibachii Nc14 TaxID=890382 RepID=F0W6N8_9STRA|nr:AlNc14C25G2526 [Albugo laibachii Nc14]|eukprot:CCA16783.1 AlNc14C25G2526 [Albugo laibachii Nc14]
MAVKEVEGRRPINDESRLCGSFTKTSKMIVILRLRKDIGNLIHPGSILHVDNQVTVAQIKGEYTSDRKKYIDLRYKFVKGQELRKMIKVQSNESKSLHLDILSKTLPAARLSKLRGLVCSIVSTSREGVLNDRNCL